MPWLPLLTFWEKGARGDEGKKASVCGKHPSHPHNSTLVRGGRGDEGRQASECGKLPSHLKMSARRLKPLFDTRLTSCYTLSHKPEINDSEREEYAPGRGAASRQDGVRSVLATVRNGPGSCGANRRRMFAAVVAAGDAAVIRARGIACAVRRTRRGRRAVRRGEPGWHREGFRASRPWMGRGAF